MRAHAHQTLVFLSYRSSWFQLDDMVESLKIELFTAQRELVEKQEECEMIEKEITLVSLSVRYRLDAT